jgi:hypothetical protein
MLPTTREVHAKVGASISCPIFRTLYEDGITAATNKPEDHHLHYLKMKVASTFVELVSVLPIVLAKDEALAFKALCRLLKVDGRKEKHKKDKLSKLVSYSPSFLTFYVSGDST